MRSAILIIVLTALLPSLLACHPQHHRTCTWQIAGDIDGKRAEMCASDELAGVIYSLTYDNVDYIADVEHGAQLQSAVSYDGHGECMNPTEGGSTSDSDKTTTSSVLERVLVAPGMLATSTRMAFWVPPGLFYAFGCIDGSHYAANTSVLSGDTVTKQVTIKSSYISYNVQYTVQSAHAATNFAPVSMSLPAEFDTAYDVDGSRIALSAEFTYPDHPVILATSDGLHAIGIIGASGARYVNGGGNGTRATLISGYFYGPTEIGKFSFQSKIFVGSLSQVQKNMSGEL